MLLNDIKPHTKAELITLQQLLTTTKTVEEARLAFPEKLLHYVEEQMKTQGKNFESIAKDIKASLNNMKYIKMYLAFEPSKQLLDRIAHELELGVRDRYIEIIVDGSLIGGAKIVIDGKQYDETIDRIIYEKCI